MSGKNFVFLDPGGRRWLWVRALAGIGLLTLLSLLVIFIRALWVKPDIRMPDSLRDMKVELTALNSSASCSDIRELKKPWLKLVPASHQRKRTEVSDSKQSRISAAMLLGGDGRGLQSLVHHSSQLTHVCVDMLTISGQPPVITADLDPDVLFAARTAKVHIVAILSNYVGQHWDTDSIEGLLRADETTQADFGDRLVKALQGMGASGVLLDWEGIDQTLSSKLVDLLRKLRPRLQKDKLELWLSIPVGDDLRAFDLENLSDVVDRLVAELHDENGEEDPPGPVASQPWFEGWLRTLMGYGEPSQWILALGAYGYDWNTTTKKTSTIGFADAMARAQKSGEEPVTSSAPLHNPSFTYDSGGQSHAVWFLDASTFTNQIRAVEQEGCGGVLISQLGTEDPGIWPILDQHSAGGPSPQLLGQLEPIDPKDMVAQVGEGAFLTADLTSEPGKRKLWLDSGGYASERYEKWPVYPAIAHFQKAVPHAVALTFDDGPDPKWTPQVLDILRQYDARATFFVIGRNAENHPSLVRRILAEGHEIGSHTYTHPNLSEATREQITLELNATQRLIQWLTGRTTMLLRPPYIADSMPATLAEARPIALATTLGYITVGESIDPEDWERPGTEEIVRRVKEERNIGGNVVLLHDAGGDRSQTVAALPQILDFLKNRGDSMVTAGRFLGLDRDQSMPLMSEKSTSIAMWVSNAGLLAVYWCEEFLWAFMIVTSLLTILRSIALAVLSLSRKPLPHPEISRLP